MLYSRHKESEMSYIPGVYGIHAESWECHMSQGTKIMMDQVQNALNPVSFLIYSLAPFYKAKTLHKVIIQYYKHPD